MLAASAFHTAALVAGLGSQRILRPLLIEAQALHQDSDGKPPPRDRPATAPCALTAAARFRIEPGQRRVDRGNDLPDIDRLDQVAERAQAHRFVDDRLVSESRQENEPGRRVGREG